MRELRDLMQGETDEATLRALIAEAEGILADQAIIIPLYLRTDPAVVSFVCDAVSGSVFAVGDTTVTCRAEDTTGNQGEASFVVTVVGDGSGSFTDVGAGSSVSTDGSGDGATPATPLETTLTTPTAGQVVMTTAPTDGDPVGYELFGLQVTISAPVASVADPLVLVFLVDSSVAGATALADVVVFRNGTAVADCTGAPQAIPDPCVSQRVMSGDDYRITVLASQASKWAFGAVEAAADPAVIRYAGTNRFGTAAAIAQGDFPTPVGTVFLAVGSNFPDALAGAAVAGKDGAPLLLVNTNSIPLDTIVELVRLNPNTIVILGGNSVISPDVEIALAAYAPTVTRLAGSNRYATAVEISKYGFPGGADEVFVATGTGFADALAAGPAAAMLGGPVLLTAPDSLPQVVADEIARLGPDRIVVVGGTSAVSAAVFAQLQAIQPNTVRLSGLNRYSTAVEISKDAFSAGADRAYVATGLNFPDALAGAAAAGWFDAPILLVPGSSIPAVVADEITRLDPTTIVVLGGTAVVSVSVETQLGTLISD
jgi:putative cell wall-binding protein